MGLGRVEHRPRAYHVASYEHEIGSEVPRGRSPNPRIGIGRRGIVPSMVLWQYCEDLVPQREVSPRELPEGSEQPLSRAQRVAWS